MAGWRVLSGADSLDPVSGQLASAFPKADRRAIRPESNDGDLQRSRIA
ncbi:MAG: hypothetical protein IPJ74_26575 [Saprospiraceae bacterium]|nr:hypothetical protein [Saprospiraceae bacterium]